MIATSVIWICALSLIGLGALLRVGYHSGFAFPIILGAVLLSLVIGFSFAFFIFMFVVLRAAATL